MSKDWITVPLGRVVTLQRGFDLPNRLRRPGSVPIITSSGMGDTHNEAMVRGPGVVTGRYGTIGEVFYIERDFWPLNTTLFVRDFHGNDPLFISYLLRTIDFQTHSGKSGVPGVNRNDLHEEVISLPSSLPEQQAIAEALRDVDGLISAVDALIAKKRAIKGGAMQELLTGQRRLPGFAGEWAVKTLGEIAIKIGSGITPTGGEKVYKAEGRPFIRSQNVGWGTLLLDDIAFIDEETHDSFKATEICAHDVLLNITGASIGRSAVADSRVENGNVNQHVCIIRPVESELNPYFLNTFLLSNQGQKQIDSFQSGGNRQGLNFGQIRSFVINLPPVAEQTAIAQILADMDAEIAALVQKRAKTVALKQGMMQMLLTGQVRLG